MGWAADGEAGTVIIRKAIDLVIGLRVSDSVERDGLDVAVDGEAVHGEAVLG